MAAQTHIRFDWAIKKLLRNKANFDILEGFISELLMQDVKILEILESESNKEDATDKSNRVDILVKSTHEELMLIEVQNEREDDYFHRMNYGQAKLTTEYLSQGDRYDKIKKVFAINIVYFELGQGTDYVYIGNTTFKGMHNQDELQLSDKQKETYPVVHVSDIFTTYYLIKVNKFDNIAKNTLDEWIYFLKNSEIKEDFKAKGIQQANERMKINNLSKSEKENYENWIKTERIRESEIITAFTDGKFKAKEELMPIIEEERRQKEEAKQKAQEAKQKEQEAKQKEHEAKQKEQEAKQKEQEAKQKEQEAKLKLAQKMKKYGESIDEIMKETGLSQREIKDL